MKDELFLPKLTRKSIRLDKKKFESSDELIRNLQIQIENVSKELLYEWSSCEIKFPPSLSGLCDDITEENDEKGRHISCKLNNLFLIPNSDELEGLAIDVNGHRKRLNKEQLQSIWSTGEFDVKSVNFPGQVHKWRLSKLLQVGTQRANADFYGMLSTSLKLVLITAKRRFTSKIFSVKDGLISIGKGVVRLVDMLIGLPHMEMITYDLNKDEKEYLLSELSLDDTEQQKYEKLIEFFKRNEKNLSFEGDFPCLFRTKDNLLIDLRLFNQTIMKKALEILEKLLELKSEEDRQWLKSLRIKIIDLQDQEMNLTREEKSQKISKILYGNYIKRCFDRILADSKLEAISPGLGQLLVNHARATIIMREALSEINAQFLAHMHTFKRQLQKHYKIKSQIDEWMSEMVREEEQIFTRNNFYAVHELALKRLRENDLHQWAYFLSRELTFRREIEPALQAKYKLEKRPTHTFKFERTIWLPKNYIIRKRVGTESEQVKPVIVDNSFVSYMSGPYSFESTTTLTNTTQFPFWRWGNTALRMITSLSNAFFLFGIFIPFVSPVSYTSVFKPSTIFPYKDVDQVTGHLCVKSKPEFHTLISRIKRLWSSASTSIEKFERTPDRGLIGKSLQRVFNRIWNYVFKGFLGSLGFILVIPITSFFISTSSILLALISPIWVPLLSICSYLVSCFIWDFDAPFRRFASRFCIIGNILIWKLIICGFGQPIVALITGSLILPLTSLLISIVACLRRLWRAYWDTIMYFLVLKPQARVPSSDTFVAVRRSGPGLATNYFYQAKPEQILAAVEFKLEERMLEAYVKHVSNLIEKPLRDYREFFDKLFAPFSYSYDEEEHDELYTKHYQWINLYNKIASRRTEILHQALFRSQLHDIRLKAQDLVVLVEKTTKLLKDNYERAILPYDGKSVAQFFNEQEMDINDWFTFGEKFLEKIFGPGILRPLEETDVFFSLEINHLNLARYTKMIANAEPRDDLDSLTRQYRPESKFLDIVEPNENTLLFNPLMGGSSSDYAKFNYATHLLNHVGLISVSIHNRNSEKKLEFIKSFYY